MRNKAKSPINLSPGPWVKYTGSRASRYIQFIEEQLIIPKGYGKGEKLKLYPYQREIIEAWLDPSVRTSMVKIARGNAKSTTMAAFATAHLFLEDDADVPVVASTVTQALKTIVDTCWRFCTLNPELEGRAVRYTAVGAQKLAVPANNSVLYPLADKPDGLQGLDPSLAILDEASIATLGTWNALVQSSGKRPESLVVGISTPTLTLPDNAMRHMERVLAEGGDVPGFYFKSYEVPLDADITDESLWGLANPALLTDPPFLDIEVLRSELRTMPQADFRCYRLAQWVEQADDCWLGDQATDIWDSLESDYELEAGAPTWVGLDYAHTFDTSAVVFGQLLEDGRPHFDAKIWRPQDTGGIDLNQIGEFLHELSRVYDLRAVYYDPYGLQLLAEHLENEGLPMVAVKQTKDFMLPCVMNTRTAIYDGNMTHSSHEGLRTQVLNAKPHYYPGEGFTLEKRKLGGKIDAAVALCLAHQAVLTVPAVREYRIYAL